MASRRLAARRWNGVDPLDVASIETVAVVAVTLGAWAIGLWWWHRSMRRRRLVEDVPTSKARGVFLGLSEVRGVATAHEPVISPYGKEECVWWRYEIHEERRDSQGRRVRRRVAERTGGHPFFDVRDETGVVRVWTPRAEVSAPRRHSEQLFVGFSEGLLAARASATRDRFVEEYTVPWEAEVYVLGTARLPEEALHPEINADPAGRDPFIIAVGSEDDVVRTERVGAVIGALIALVAGPVAALFANQGRAIFGEPGLELADVRWWAPLAGLLGTVWVMVLLWGIFVYNALVAVGNRARAAWSMIDVQLRRRHDLIPALDAVVHAHREHEAELLPLLAELRSHVHDELPEAPSDDAVRVAEGNLGEEAAAIGGLAALVEAHPDLGADASFRRLRDELVDTEDRIALARAFYNDSVERLRDRSRTFPGVLVAWLFELSLDAEFVDVDLPDRTPPQVVVVADPFVSPA